MIALISVIGGLVVSVLFGWLTFELAGGVGVLAAIAAFREVRDFAITVCGDVRGVVSYSATGTLLPDDGKESLDYLRRLRDEDNLDDAGLERLQRAENTLRDRAFNALEASIGVENAVLAEDEKDALREIGDLVVEEADSYDCRALGRFGEGDPRERDALERITEGDVSGGLGDLERAAEEADAENAERWRRIGAIAFPVDVGRALNAYERALVLDGSDPWDAIFAARLFKQLGSLHRARETLAVLEGRQTTLDDRTKSVLFDEIANVLAAQGDSAGALENYRAAIVIRQRLAETDPKNTEWQRDLSVSYEKVGNALRAQGDGAGALESYRAGMVIAQRLADTDPKNSQWQRDLTVSHIMVGDGLRAHGDGAGALESYRVGLTIAQRLAETDPKNTQWQRDVSASHDRIGDVLVAQGDGAGALESYRASLKITQRLAESDPKNTQWRRDVAVTNWNLARFENSGISWADVARAWQGMKDDGVLNPVDEGFVDEANRRAAAD